MNRSYFALLVFGVLGGCAPRPALGPRAVERATVDTTDPSFKPAEESGLTLDESKLETPEGKNAKRVLPRSSMQLPPHIRPTGSVHAATR